MRFRVRLLVPVWAALVAVLAGCSPETPMEPADRDFHSTPGLVAESRNDVGLTILDKGGPGFVDLKMARLTAVAGILRARTIRTGQAPGPWFEVPYSVERQIIGLGTPIAGVTYRTERVVQLEPSGPTTTIDLWRQDKSGLYLYQPEEAPPGLRATLVQMGTRARVAPAEATAFARAWAQVAAKRAAIVNARPGGPLESEITFLRYPLHKGSTWEGREGFNVWTVEEYEWLDTPAGRFRAVRLRIELPEFFGPDDSAITWWDEPGEVRRAFRLFGDAVDDQGNTIGEIETLEEFLVTRYEPGSGF